MREREGENKLEMARRLNLGGSTDSWAGCADWKPDYPITSDGIRWNGSFPTSTSHPCNQDDSQHGVGATTARKACFAMVISRTSGHHLLIREETCLTAIRAVITKPAVGLEESIMRPIFVLPSATLLFFLFFHSHLFLLPLSLFSFFSCLLEKYTHNNNHKKTTLGT